MLSNFIEVCNDKFNSDIILTYNEGCLILKQGNDILMNWCYCQDLIYLLDGYEILDTKLLPGQTLELFNNDNGGDIVGKTHDELLDKLYVKGGFVWIGYPKVDAVENAIDESDKNVKLLISNIYDDNGVYNSSELSLSLYTFFSQLTNPENGDILNVPNYWKVTNTTTYDIQVKGLILLSKNIE